MIQANEFRIGNYAKDAISGELLKVFYLDEDNGFGCHVVDRTKYPLPNTWQMIPIPLTPEILKKCGFEKKMDIYKIVTKNLDYCFRISFTGSGYFSQNAIANKPINYLHQLQNLYYALTGEELTYNQTIK